MAPKKKRGPTTGTGGTPRTSHKRARIRQNLRIRVYPTAPETDERNDCFFETVMRSLFYQLGTTHPWADPRPSRDAQARLRREVARFVRSQPEIVRVLQDFIRDDPLDLWLTQVPEGRNPEDADVVDAELQVRIREMEESGHQIDTLTVTATALAIGARLVVLQRRSDGSYTTEHGFHRRYGDMNDFPHLRVLGQGLDEQLPVYIHFHAGDNYEGGHFQPIHTPDEVQRDPATRLAAAAALTDGEDSGLRTAIQIQAEDPPEATETTSDNDEAVEIPIDEAEPVSSSSAFELDQLDVPNLATPDPESRRPRRNRELERLAPGALRAREMAIGERNIQNARERPTVNLGFSSNFQETYLPWQLFRSRVPRGTEDDRPRRMTREQFVDMYMGRTGQVPSDQLMAELYPRPSVLGRRTPAAPEWSKSQRKEDEDEDEDRGGADGDDSGQIPSQPTASPPEEPTPAPPIPSPPPPQPPAAPVTGRSDPRVAQVDRIPLGPPPPAPTLSYPVPTESPEHALTLYRAPQSTEYTPLLPRTRPPSFGQLARLAQQLQTGSGGSTLDRPALRNLYYDLDGVRRILLRARDIRRTAAQRTEDLMEILRRMQNTPFMRNTWGELYRNFEIQRGRLDDDRLDEVFRLLEETFTAGEYTAQTVRHFAQRMLSGTRDALLVGADTGLSVYGRVAGTTVDAVHTLGDALGTVTGNIAQGAGAVVGGVLGSAVGATREAVDAFRRTTQHWNGPPTPTPIPPPTDGRPPPPVSPYYVPSPAPESEAVVEPDGGIEPDAEPEPELLPPDPPGPSPEPVVTPQGELLPTPPPRGTPTSDLPEEGETEALRRARIQRFEPLLPRDPPPEAPLRETPLPSAKPAPKAAAKRPPRDVQRLLQEARNPTPSPEVAPPPFQPQIRYQPPPELVPALRERYRSGATAKVYSTLAERRAHRARLRAKMPQRSRHNPTYSTGSSELMRTLMVDPGNWYGGRGKRMVIRGSGQRGRPRSETGVGRMKNPVRNRDMANPDDVHDNDIVVYTSTAQPKRGQPANRAQVTTWGRFSRMIQVDEEGRNLYNIRVLRGMRLDDSWYRDHPASPDYPNGRITMGEAERIARILDVKLPMRLNAERMLQAEQDSTTLWYQNERLRDMGMTPYEPKPRAKPKPKPQAQVPPPSSSSPSEVPDVPDELNIGFDPTLYDSDDYNDPETRSVASAPAAVPTSTVPVEPQPVNPEALDRLNRRLRGFPDPPVPARLDVVGDPNSPDAVRVHPITPPDAAVDGPTEVGTPAWRRAARLVGLNVVESSSGSSTKAASEHPPTPDPPLPITAASPTPVEVPAPVTTEAAGGAEVAIGEMPRDELDPRVARQSIFADLRSAHEANGTMGRMAQVRRPQRVPLRLVDFAGEQLEAAIHYPTRNPHASPEERRRHDEYRRLLHNNVLQRNLEHMQELGIPPR